MTERCVWKRGTVSDPNIHIAGEAWFSSCCIYMWVGYDRLPSECPYCGEATIAVWDRRLSNEELEDLTSD